MRILLICLTLIAIACNQADQGSNQKAVKESSALDAEETEQIADAHQSSPQEKELLASEELLEIQSVQAPSVASKQELCRMRNVLIYSLQPKNSNATLEHLGEQVVAPLANIGISAQFSNRTQVPQINYGLLKRFPLVVFISGCGGSTGVVEGSELTAIRDYYLSGGNLSIITDDDNGNSGSTGSCFDRISLLAGSLGVSFSSSVDNKSHGCSLPELDDPFLAGIKLGRGISSAFSLTGRLSWGSTYPKVIARLKNGSPAEID